MLDSKIQSLKDYFGVTHPEDWQAITPDMILRRDGIGQVTLDYLRLLLASRGLTLKGDRTPEYWQQHLKDVRISHTLANEPLLDDLGQGGGDRGVLCPFVVLIDTAEQHPFSFQGMRSSDDRPLIVNTEFRSLGRFPDSLGDYSLDTGVGRCHVERKSMEDAHGTFLGWTKKGEDVGRRDRFESELEKLSEMEAGLVIIECSFTDLIRLAPQYGRRSAQQNAKTLHRSIIAWNQDFAVNWLFCDGRRVAEQTTFQWLERWDRKDREERKREEKRLAKVNGKPEQKQTVAAELAAI